MFELVEKAGEARVAPTRYGTLDEAVEALSRRADELRVAYGAETVTAVVPRFVVALHERGITVACLRRCA